MAKVLDDMDVAEALLLVDREKRKAEAAVSPRMGCVVEESRHGETSKQRGSDQWKVVEVILPIRGLQAQGDWLSAVTAYLTKCLIVPSFLVS